MGIRERKRRDRERRRQEILIAARRVFTAKGLNKATMEEIAKAAELSAGTLYLYFKNKNELIVSLSVKILEFMTIRLQDVLSQSNLSPEEKLNQLLQVFFEMHDFDPLILINLFHLQSSDTLKNLSPPVLMEIKELSGRALGMVGEIFHEGVRKGVFIDRHPMALADGLWGLFSGIVLWEESKRMIDQDKDYLRTSMETAFEVYARGVKR
jgi:AcrR family transcriptional regulator